MTERNYGRLAITAGIALLVLVGLCFGLVAAGKEFQRYQKRADANNRVHVSNIEIRNQEQRVQVEQQRAQIRYIEATGIRRAQDEIAKTLTPMYVAHELTQAMKEIAVAGSNTTVIYIPTDPATGLPVVPTSSAGSKP